METLTASSPKNRRRSVRRAARNSVKAECRKGAYGLGADLAVQLLDLSDSGIRLIIKQALDIRAEVEIIIGGYGMRQPLKRLGNVRWLIALEGGLFGVGIEFQKHLPYREWQTLASPS